MCKALSMNYPWAHTIPFYLWICEIKNTLTASEIKCWTGIGKHLQTFQLRKKEKTKEKKEILVLIISKSS